MAFAAASCSLPASANAVSGQGTWESTLQSRDLTGDGVADAFYDTSLGITWLADAKASGLLSWSAAMAWASGLSVGSTTGWRLPKGVSACAPENWDVTGDCQYQAPTTAEHELANLYFATLGNPSPGPNGSRWPHGLQNTGPFENLETPAEYWTSTATIAHGRPLAVEFYTRAGESFWHPTDRPELAWAVHAGDVGEPLAVPEPSGMLLALGALLAAAARGLRVD